MSGWVWALAVWTAFAAAWWAIAVGLVSAGPPPRRPVAPDGRRLSIFKPVAGPFTDDDRRSLRRCIETFVGELDSSSELLIGVAESDRAAVHELLEPLRARYPAAEIKLVAHSDPDEYRNRKIALMKAMARYASGELWFWSDADMKAPRGTLASLRADFAAAAAAGADFVTSPYRVTEAPTPAAQLDELFVNAEFLPGVLLLARLDRIRFGFGSGMLFEARRFKRSVDWDFLGGCLADDYHLGQALGRGRLAATCLSTVPAPRSRRSALLHYLRWHKTIRWCRPGGYASQLLVLPVVGWAGAILLEPSALVAWLGLGTAMVLDSAGAGMLCRRLGARAQAEHTARFGWSLLRGLVWLACWLPWPIVWRGRRWWAQHAQGEARRPQALDTGRG